MQYDRLIPDLARSVGFLSRLPVPERYFAGSDGRVADAAALFPAAGLIVALPAAVLIFLLAAFEAPSALTALVAIAATILATGALHEDGLSDCADAFGAGGPAERMLAILKDSRIGTYGALALILTIALKAVALTVLIAVGPPLAAAFLYLAAAALSRALMVVHWEQLPSARPEGVAGRAGRPEGDAARVALAIGGLLALAAVVYTAGWLAALFTLLLTWLAAWLWTRHAGRKIGGQTGDTIGATQQIAETAFLVALVLAL